MFSVGTSLQKERLRKGYTLAQVEKQIRVREKFLSALEQNNWDAFASKIYVTGIIKNYSRFLGLDDRKMLAFFRREYERKEDVRFKRRVENTFLTSDTKRLVIGAVVVIFALFIGYFLIQLKQYVSPPQIVIIEPKGTVFKRVNSIRIVGKTEKESTVMIFRQRVYQNKEGFFEYDLPLTKEQNTLSIEVTGPNGRKTSLSKVFIRKE
jgi:transcriptional regulator with XRE-family HTH domain